MEHQDQRNCDADQMGLLQETVEYLQREIRAVTGEGEGEEENREEENGQREVNGEEGERQGEGERQEERQIEEEESPIWQDPVQ